MDDHFHAVMDRNIFKLELTVEATSAYIVVASLLDDNVRPSMDLIRARWTTSDQELDDALDELVSRNVVRRQETPDGQPLYYPNPSSVWN